METVKINEARLDAQTVRLTLGGQELARAAIERDMAANRKVMFKAALQRDDVLWLWSTWTDGLVEAGFVLVDEALERVGLPAGCMHLPDLVRYVSEEMGGPEELWDSLVPDHLRLTTFVGPQTSAEHGWSSVPEHTLASGLKVRITPDGELAEADANQKKEVRS